MGQCMKLLLIAFIYYKRDVSSYGFHDRIFFLCKFCLFVCFICYSNCSTELRAHHIPQPGKPAKWPGHN